MPRSSVKDAKRCYEKAGLGTEWSQVVQAIRKDHYRKAGFMGRFEELVAGQAPGAKPSFLERAKTRWPSQSGN